ncbi:MAG: response regulator [Clostridiales bacterium]
MPKNILVIDLSKFEREKIKFILKNFDNLNVIELLNFKESVIDFIDSNNISIIISDILLPNESEGFKFLSTIRNNKISEKTPIIITTKSDNIEIRKKIIQYDISDYILKPFTISRLENSLKTLIKFEKVSTYKMNNNKITMSFEHYINKELKTCGRVQQPLSILFITPISSVKNFYNENSKKQNNDEFFSIAADKLRKSLRETDTVILNGNNDILTILPFTDSKNATTVLEKTKSNIESYLKKSNTSYNDNFYSVIVSYPDDGMDFQSLMSVVNKKISDKKLLEKIVSIPLNTKNMIYTKNYLKNFKNYLK